MFSKCKGCIFWKFPIVWLMRYAKYLMVFKFIISWKSRQTVFYIIHHNDLVLFGCEVFLLYNNDFYIKINLLIFSHHLSPLYCNVKAQQPVGQIRFSSNSNLFNYRLFFSYFGKSFTIFFIFRICTNCYGEIGKFSLNYILRTFTLRGWKRASYCKPNSPNIIILFNIWNWCFQWLVQRNYYHLLLSISTDPWPYQQLGHIPNPILSILCFQQLQYYLLPYLFHLGLLLHLLVF